MDGEDGDVDRMEKGDDSSSDGDASDTEMQQQITELEAVVSFVWRGEWVSTRERISHTRYSELHELHNLNSCK